jgi:hypothetical protein
MSVAKKKNFEARPALLREIKSKLKLNIDGGWMFDKV